MALFSLVGMLAGVLLAVKFSAVVAGYLHEKTDIPGQWLPVAAFLIILIGVSLLVRVAGAVLEKAIEMAMLGIANKLGGAVLYILLYGFLISIMLYYATKAGICEPEQTGLAGFLQPIGPAIIGFIGNMIPVLGDMLKDLDAYFNKQ